LPRCRLHASHSGSGCSVRGTIQPFESLKQSPDAGPVPLGTEWRRYFSLVQRACDGFDGEARFPKFKNCWAQCLGSDVRGPRECQAIVAVTGLDQAQTYQQPCHGSAMPLTAVGGWYSPSVQFIHQLTLGNEACRHKLSNGGGHSSGVAVCWVRGPARPLRLAGRYPVICLLHCSIIRETSAALQDGVRGKNVASTKERPWCSKLDSRNHGTPPKSRDRERGLMRRNPTSLVSASNALAPRADALARRILLSIYLATDGRPLAECRMSSLHGATAEAMLFALRSRWLELKDNCGVCLTAEGRRLAIRQAN
jgi:hypothetical protein